LDRLLDSAEHLEREFGCRREWHVLDDSRDPAHRARNRAIVAQHALDCTWHDLHAHDAWREGLHAAFREARREIEWLLGGGDGAATYGRPINHALLRFAGRRWLAIDDDVLLDARRCPAPLAGFGVASEADELLAYESHDEALAACEAARVDPLAEHERWLGGSLGVAWTSAVRAHGAPAVEVSSRDSLRFAPDARVLFTQNAAVDDPGSSLFPYHVLSLPAASLAHATASASRARCAFVERHAWRGARRLRLAPRRLLTFTTIAGIDSRRLLPPTVPMHRNEDLLLGGIAQIVHPHAWFADLPFGVPHVRAVRKQWLPASAGFAQEPLHVVLDALEGRALDIAAVDPARRMATVSALVADLAHAGERELADMIEAQAIDTATRVLFSIHSQLDDARVAATWKQALQPWLGSPALAVEG